MGACRRCEIDLLHCHGTLVRHDDGGRECTVEGCSGDTDVHDIVLACVHVWPGCCGEPAEAVARSGGGGRRAG